jgi:hypothetical protein
LRMSLVWQRILHYSVCSPQMITWLRRLQVGTVYCWVDIVFESKWRKGLEFRCDNEPRKVMREPTAARMAGGLALTYINIGTRNNDD